MSGPYESEAQRYWDAGWRGILPLPLGKKKDPPAGYTGWDGRDPSYPDVLTWVDDRGDGNIALHLPPGVIGIDVDNYGDKRGAETLAAWEASYGALPATWKTTSRSDGTSGIRLFRAPVGLRWPGTFGNGTETIHSGHRYVVAPPSIHPSGGTYRWFGPDGVVTLAGMVPLIADLPRLPWPWIDGLTRGREAKVLASAGMDAEDIEEWLHTHQFGDGQPCERMGEAIGIVFDAMRDGAHESILGPLMHVVGLGARGHHGLLTAVKRIRKEFVHVVTEDDRESRRDDREAAEEWRRALFGAIDKVVGERQEEGAAEPDGDPCVHGEPSVVGPLEFWPEPSPVTGSDEKDPGHEDRGGNDEQPTGPTPAERREMDIARAEAEMDIREEAKRRLAARDVPRLRRLSALEFRDAPRPEALVSKVFYRDSLARIYGQPGCGKSFLAMDLAMHVALGRDWRGEHVERGRVFYVMAEGQAVNVQRVEAWCERNGATFEELEGWFDAFPDALSLTESAMREFVAACTADQPALVILDTKNAMMVGEENSASDFAVMRRALDAVRTSCSACVTLIDHTGYEGTRARGTSAATAGMDTEMFVVKSEDHPPLITAKVTRDKAAEAGSSWSWHLRMAADAAALVPAADAPEDDLRRDDGPLAWQDMVIPIELVNYIGDGQKSIVDLAKLMSFDANQRRADPAGMGMTKADATKVLKPLGHDDTTTRRAWSALIDMGYLVPAEGVKAKHLRHVWAY